MLGGLKAWKLESGKVGRLKGWEAEKHEGREDLS